MNLKTALAPPNFFILFRLPVVASAWMTATIFASTSGSAFAAEASAAKHRTPLADNTLAIGNETPVAKWTFERAEEIWPALHDCTVKVDRHALRIESTGDDPYLRIPVGETAGPLEFRWRMRTTGRGPAEIFWTTKARPRMGPEQSIRIHSENDGQWHEYVARLPEPEFYTALRLDPVTSVGSVEIADASLVRYTPLPLQFTDISAVGRTIKTTVRNGSPTVIAATLGPTTTAIPPGETRELPLTAPAQKRFEAIDVSITSPGNSPLARRNFLYHPEAPIDAIEFGNDRARVRLARDGSGAELLFQGTVVAIVSPLAEFNGDSVPFKVTRETEGVELAGGAVEKLTLRVDGDEVLFDLAAKEPVCGPSLRALGEMEQSLLAGVEYLERGERSSSKLDLVGIEHLRYEPDPLLLTMPLAAAVTNRGGVALLWNDPKLRPVFAAPNVYDGTPDVRMAVQGQSMSLRVRLTPSYSQSGRIEDAILWAVKTRGLPELPATPRSVDAQRALSLAAFEGPIKGVNGWAHAVGGGPAPSHYFADHASAIWRLTGRLPELPALVPGGSHVENPAAFFVSGRTHEWLANQQARVQGILREQQPDGSFHYHGKYERGHFEDTASGWCAQRAAILLEHAWYTGDKDSLAAGLKALEYLKRFRTPRGAQTWEIPLHTPDIYASALLVRAYVRGYELTHNEEYLILARRWAISGLPFVYQWNCRPIMSYATIAVLGATDWTGVVWIGLPVQWCGTVYAHSLTLLAPYDKTLDWLHVANGILITAEQMQYPDGPHLGCLPDSFDLLDQRRLPADINPCVLVALRLRLGGELDSLAVATDGKHRVVAPFPVTLEGETAHIHACAGEKYEILLDGQRILKVESRGEDTLNLAADAKQ